MMFFLTALDQQANQKEFSFEPFSIEKGFDFLSRLVTQGNTLLSVYVAEDNHRIDLPLEAFDGLPFSPAIHDLQQEWQTVLSESIPPNSPDRRFIGKDYVMFVTVVEEIKSQVMDCQCLLRNATIMKYRADLQLNQALKQVEQAKNRMALIRLRVLQIEARIDAILAKDNRDTTKK